MKPCRTARAAPLPSTTVAHPEGYEIKGNADSMLYHVPGSRYYKATKAEVYFATVTDAESRGAAPPRPKRPPQKSRPEPTTRAFEDVLGKYHGLQTKTRRRRQPRTTTQRKTPDGSEGQSLRVPARHHHRLEVALVQRAPVHRLPHRGLEDPRLDHAQARQRRSAASKSSARETSSASTSTPPDPAS